MTVSFYANIISTISHKWVGHPGALNHQNIDEIPAYRVGMPYTIDCKNYNSGYIDQLDVYGVSFTPLPADATNIKMGIGTRMRTLRHFGLFYAHLGIYNGSDHWYRVGEVLDPGHWKPICTGIISSWSRNQVNLISQVKLKADTNPIDVAALYLYIQYD